MICFSEKEMEILKELVSVNGTGMEVCDDGSIFYNNEWIKRMIKDLKMSEREVREFIAKLAQV